jgi:hypothetical protein
MDYQQILHAAEKKLKGKYDDVIAGIEECISLGSTGGEISSLVGKFVKDLRYTNPSAYSILENEIADYLNECKRAGIFII